MKRIWDVLEAAGSGTALVCVLSLRQVVIQLRNFLAYSITARQVPNGRPFNGCEDPMGNLFPEFLLGRGAPWACSVRLARVASDLNV